MPLWKPSDAELQALIDDCRLKCGTTTALLDNHIFSALFHRERGLYAWKHKKPVWSKESGEWVRYRRRLRMREWIETYVRIQDKSGNIVPFILNSEQRQVIAMALRLERCGLPVRLSFCKARQVGISTLGQAICLYYVLTGSNIKALLVGDNKDRAEMLLGIAHVARRNMPKGSDPDGEIEVWRFKMKNEASYTLEWKEPIGGQIKVASAEEPEPGQGGTRTVLHLSETASGSYTQEKIINILPSLPTLPGTIGLNESTPSGTSGWFYDTFMNSWRERERPLMERRCTWHAMFFPWWGHEEYVWTRTYGHGRQIPESMRKEMHETLTQDEEWLLKQQWLRRWKPTDEWVQVPCSGNAQWINGKWAPIDFKWARLGVGFTNCTYDHIAYWRAKLADPETGGDVNLAMQEMAMDPLRCFLASGRSVFDREALSKMIEEAQQPIWRGTLEEPLDKEGQRVAPRQDGWDPVWKGETSEH